jgi:hypothetical protein
LDTISYIATSIRTAGCRLVLIVLMICCCGSVYASPDGDEPVGDEVTIELANPVIGRSVIPAVLVGDTVYIKPIDLLNYVKVRTELEAGDSIISGYFIEENNHYRIDLGKHEIEYLKETHKLSPKEYLSLESGIYIRTTVFEKIFNIKLHLDFSNLTLNVSSEVALPAERIAMDDRNLAKSSSSGAGGKPFVAERTFGLQRSFFSVGNFDYSGGATYFGNPFKNFVDTLGQYNYRLVGGGQLFGGDFDATITGDQTTKKIDWDKSAWQWRYSIPGSSILNEVVVGRRAAFGNLALADSMVGIQVTNSNKGARPSTYSNYVISDYTEPNWTVELYINETMVNYTKADQTGYYKFTIPLNYGRTPMKLRFRGPYGEVRTKETVIEVPYTFLVPGEVEYTLTGGTSYLHPNDINSTTGKLDLKFGITHWITLAGGVRYTHAPDFKPVFRPYATSSLALTNDILLAGEYYHQSGYKTTLNISGPLGMTLTANYDHVLPNALTYGDEIRIAEQRKLQISSPLPFVQGSFRMSAIDIPLDAKTGTLTLQNQLILQFFGTSMDISAGISFFRDGYKLYRQSSSEVSSGSMGFTITPFWDMTFHPSASIDYLNLTVKDVSLSISKTFSNWLGFSVMGSHTFDTKDNFQVSADLHLNLPFAQIGFTGSKSNFQTFQTNSTIQGSVAVDPFVPIVNFSNGQQVRHGGLEVIPYLDTNNNGRYDANEPKVPRMTFEQSGGAVTEHSDGTLTVVGMEPYKVSNFKLSANNVENISWVPKFQSFSVVPPANGFTVVEIPLSIAGQIEGYVNVQKPGEDKEDALGGARILIRHNEPGDSSMVKLSEDLLTYSTGEFYYLGIQPGKYRAYVDPKQLSLLHYSCEPAYIDFEVKSKEEGDVIEGLNFLAKPTPTSEDPGPPKALK